MPSIETAIVILISVLAVMATLGGAIAWMRKSVIESALKISTPPSAGRETPMPRGPALEWTKVLENFRKIQKHCETDGQYLDAVLTKLEQENSMGAFADKVKAIEAQRVADTATIERLTATVAKQKADYDALVKAHSESLSQIKVKIDELQNAGIVDQADIAAAKSLTNL